MLDGRASARGVRTPARLAKSNTLATVKRFEASAWNRQYAEPPRAVGKAVHPAFTHRRGAMSRTPVHDVSDTARWVAYSQRGDEIRSGGGSFVLPGARLGAAGGKVAPGRGSTLGAGDALRIAHALAGVADPWPPREISQSGRVCAHGTRRRRPRGLTSVATSLRYRFGVRAASMRVLSSSDAASGRRSKMTSVPPSSPSHSR
jgi:hypothetical protein